MSDLRDDILRADASIAREVVEEGSDFAADLVAAYAMIASESGAPDSIFMSKRTYDIQRVTYDPDSRFARKYRRRQAKRRLKNGGRAWV